MMLEASKQRSEVARIQACIRAEYESAQQGFTGFAVGSSQHAFISAWMENMNHLHTELRDLIGDVAIAMIAAQLEGNLIPLRKHNEASPHSFFSLLIPML